MSKILTLDEIKAATDLPREEVEVPEWGGSVVVQGVSVEQGMELFKQMRVEGGGLDEIDPEKAALLALVHGVVEPKFKAEDMEWLRQKSLGAVTKISKVFMRLSGFDQEALKDARKNS